MARVETEVSLCGRTVPLEEALLFSDCIKLITENEGICPRESDDVDTRYIELKYSDEGMFFKVMEYKVVGSSLDRKGERVCRINGENRIPVRRVSESGNEEFPITEYYIRPAGDVKADAAVGETYVDFRGYFLGVEEALGVSETIREMAGAEPGIENPARRVIYVNSNSGELSCWYEDFPE